jgi:hypothetical protein
LKHQFSLTAAFQVTWRTGDETDVAHYVVQRSTDGRNYEDIATIAANGNSFSYHDKDLVWELERLFTGFWRR